MTGEYVCLMYNRSETYTVYHSKLACPPVNLRSMMLFVCPDLSPSCLFHCHHRGVDKFVGLGCWVLLYIVFLGQNIYYPNNEIRTGGNSGTGEYHGGQTSAFNYPGILHNDYFCKREECIKKQNKTKQNKKG